MEIHLELAQSLLALLENSLSESPDPEVDTRESARFRERCGALLPPEQFPSIQTDSLRHLGGGAIEVLNQMKARISVLGRQLTEEELRLLDVIYQAEERYLRVFAPFAFTAASEQAVRTPVNLSTTPTPGGKLISLIWEGLECTPSSPDAPSSSRCQSHLVLPVDCGSEEPVDAFGVTLKGSFNLSATARASILVEINGYAFMKEFTEGGGDEAHVGQGFTWKFFVPVGRMPRSQGPLHHFDVRAVDGLFVLSTFRQKAEDTASLWLDSADVEVVQGMARTAA